MENPALDFDTISDSSSASEDYFDPAVGANIDEDVGFNRHRLDRFRGQHRLKQAVESGNLQLFHRVCHQGQALMPSILEIILNRNDLILLEDCFSNTRLTQQQLETVFLHAASLGRLDMMQLTLPHLANGLASLNLIDNLWNYVFQSRHESAIQTMHGIWSMPNGMTFVHMDEILAAAVQQANWHVIPDIMEAGATLDSTFDAFESLFFEWAREANEDKARTAMMLIQLGYMISSFDYATKLLYYATANEVPILQRLGANFRSRLNNKSQVKTHGELPLHRATRLNDLELMESLLNHGARADGKANGGLTALHLATSRAAVELLTGAPWFLELEVPSLKNKTALGMAVERGNYEAVDALITAGARTGLDVGGKGLVHIAADRRDIPLLCLLLQHNVSRVTAGENILVWAARGCRFDVMEAIVRYFPRIWHELSRNDRFCVSEALEEWPAVEGQLAAIPDSG